MTPLPRPSMDYVSVGPYTITFEWSDHEISIAYAATLEIAMQAFWCDSSADRGVVFDARGITILGFNEAGLVAEEWVATREVLRALESLGLNDAGMVDLIELELSCLYHEEKS